MDRGHRYLFGLRAQVWLVSLCLLCTLTRHALAPPPGSHTPQKIAFKNTDTKTFTHDHTCFTQGLQWLNSTTLIESCGGYGKSRLLMWDPEGGPGNTPLVRKDVRLPRGTHPRGYFAEGLTVVGDKIFLLTWKEKDILVYDLLSFEYLGLYTFNSDGWGLAYDEREEILYATNGSQYLMQLEVPSEPPRMKAPFTAIKIKEAKEVRCFAGAATKELNEIEFVRPYILSNIWYDDRLVMLEPKSGECLGVLDFHGQYSKHRGEDVFNGIAWSKDRGTEKLMVTGKLWEKMFELTLTTPVYIPAPDEKTAPTEAEKPSSKPNEAAHAHPVSEGGQTSAATEEDAVAATHEAAKGEAQAGAHAHQEAGEGGDGVKTSASASASVGSGGFDEGPSAFLEFLSELCGVLYVLFWTISFYPQVYLNWKRNSVVGMSLDFVALNVFGFGCYTVYTIVQYRVQIQHKLAHAVEAQDIVFAAHAFAISLFTWGQAMVYDKGGQRVTKPCKIVFWTFALAIGAHVVMASIGMLNWATATSHVPMAKMVARNQHYSIQGHEEVARVGGALPPSDSSASSGSASGSSSGSGPSLWGAGFLLESWSVMTFLGLVKATITCIKYIPQVLLNFFYESTDGMEAKNFVFDFLGGFLSLAQNGIDAVNYRDLSFVLGNIPKIIIGLVAVSYDTIILFQHFVLYKGKLNPRCSHSDTEPTTFMFAPSMSQRSRGKGGRGVHAGGAYSPGDANGGARVFGHAYEEDSGEDDYELPEVNEDDEDGLDVERGSSEEGGESESEGNENGQGEGGKAGGGGYQPPQDLLGGSPVGGGGRG
uniref:Uncharacterized protein n=1 Tax=Chromera velia CCMP2878 TaxID=1169474 RepID=A0A0G4FN38_9ALVE|eukprot:Cvel_17682.t1-p1 / transcript=Cvel_17682.t1 / gene=Cvel_17682 / organism=Chromera_velia_CCMP2878 / gene_product=Glutaminyl-peptide cyclotransferase, putative / transcript_product=Glutaminyl-peptide cyclotransferase, putative / location=Cvel_scaffold1426:15421-23169(-) / protein_length=816 / sequence_SO=supercontig / SO=protein_coding / is_pseudo=false